VSFVAEKMFCHERHEKHEIFEQEAAEGAEQQGKPLACFLCSLRFLLFISCLLACLWAHKKFARRWLGLRAA
jgi:hypothetical protein